MTTLSKIKKGKPIFYKIVTEPLFMHLHQCIRFFSKLFTGKLALQLSMYIFCTSDCSRKYLYNLSPKIDCTKFSSSTIPKQFILSFSKTKFAEQKDFHSLACIERARICSYSIRFIHIKDIFFYALMRSYFIII